jgi:hypothetical protein
VSRPQERDVDDGKSSRPPLSLIARPVHRAAPLLQPTIREPRRSSHLHNTSTLPTGLWPTAKLRSPPTRNGRQTGGGLNRKRLVPGALRCVAGQGCWVGDRVSYPRAVKRPRRSGIDPRPPNSEVKPGFPSKTCIARGAVSSQGPSLPRFIRITRRHRFIITITLA